MQVIHSPALLPRDHTAPGVDVFGNERSGVSEAVVAHRSAVLKRLLPLFPEAGAAGVYISRKLNAEMGVAGDEISITFYK